MDSGRRVGRFGYVCGFGGEIVRLCVFSRVFGIGIYKWYKKLLPLGV